MQKINRCSVCKIEITQDPRRKTCGDIKCRSIRKQHADSQRSKNRTVENRVTKAEKLLVKFGFIVIPPTHKHRVIIEPVSEIGTQ